MTVAGWGDYLNAGVMENGLVSPTEEGTPQGGPLSPLLSNIVLDDLDRELEKRGHRFVRYADDANIYVKSERAGQRVMERSTTFIEKRLKFTVNRTKSAVAQPKERQFLGFSFTGGREVKRRIAPHALERFKKRVRKLTNPEPREEDGEDGRETLCLSERVGRVRWLLSDPLGTPSPGLMDQTAAAVCELETVENPTSPDHRVEPPRRPRQ